MEHLRRREFLGMSLGVAASLGAKEPEVKFPAEPRIRLSVSTYPFRHEIATAQAEEGEAGGSGMTLEQFARTIPAKFNVHRIEPWGRHLKSTDPDYVHGLRSAFQGAGLHVVNIPVDIREHLCGNDSERNESLAGYRKWVDAAVILGSPSIRVHMPQGEKGDQISCAVRGLKMVAEYGASKNVVVNIENDEPEIEQPARIARVIKAVDNRYLRALPDFCNSMIIQDDQNFNNTGLRLLFPLAYNISHVKDSEQDGKKIYRVDVDQIFAIAKEAGYKGYFSMEFEGAGDPYQGTKKLLDASLRALG